MPRPIPEAAVAGILFALYAAGQSNAALTLYQSNYQLKPGESAAVPAANETIQFLNHAAKRELTRNGVRAEGLVISPSSDGTGVVLGVSLRTKPGNYTVRLAATGPDGVEREASLSVAVAELTTVPNNAARPPVVLLNGWIGGFDNSCPVAASSAQTFGNLAQYLVSDGAPVVYLFDNCLEDPNASIETLAQDLGTFLNSITYANGAQVPQIDLVAHSMGGLIARAYLAGLQPGGTYAPPTPTLVRDLVMIAVPNFGSFVAGTYNLAFPAGGQSAEMIPGSSFLWNLATWNQRQDDLQGVNSIAVIGNAGQFTGGINNSTVLNNASDGLVSLTSASLDFILQGAGITRIVPYCHVDPSAFINTNLGTFLCNAPGIANVTSPSHLTGQIVRSFLAGTTAWQSIGTTPATDPYLSTDGGLYFAAVGQENQYLADVTSVQWGTLPFLPGGDLDTVFYYDFINGTGLFEAVSQSQGTLDCGTLKEPAGYYSAARCKVDTAIFSVSPLVKGADAILVNSGGNITLTGYAFGNSQCSGCKVQATPAGSTTTTNLAISSWNNTSITAALPASFTGFITIAVTAAQGVDAINIMAVAPSTIGLSKSSVQFSYTAGGSAPASQTVQITTSGISWTAAATTTTGGSWLAVSPSSGTSPSTLTISVSPSSLAAGTYAGVITISSSSSSSGSSTATISVSLTVAGGQPVLAVGATSLSFTYDYSGALPAAQTVSISNTGTGALSWTASDPDFWVALSPASGTGAATLSINVNPANLAAGSYTSTVTITAPGAAGSPATIALSVTVTGAPPSPVITGVANSGDYQPAFASATWLAIFGSNLSQATAAWTAANFVNNALPTSLDGVSVTVNGVPAYVEFVSPGQINVLAPDDSTVGPVNIQVTTAGQPSNTVSAPKQQFAPAFLTIDNGAYVTALHTDGTLVAAANLLGAGVVSSPASPGETIEIYATGFGPTNPAAPTADLVTNPAMLANSVQMTIGGMNALVVYAGLVSPGLYQFNVTIPNLPSGDAPIAASVSGVQTQPGVAIPIQ